MEKETKTCFIICPLDEPGSEIRKQSDYLFKTVIHPVLVPLGYEVKRADLVHGQDSIPDSISIHIFKDDLVIADLSDCNPNVFYELGKRHSWGRPCVHLTDDMEKLPFDVHHYRIIKYNLNEPSDLDRVRRDLRLEVEAIKNTPPQCPYPMTPEELIAITGATIVLDRKEGRREHYYLAERLAKLSCKRIFLMQRSSSLILGPELGWDAERLFYDALLKQIAKNIEFYHIVSIEGIKRHLERPQSKFPETSEALKKLYKKKGVVGIKNEKTFWPFRKIPDVSQIEDLKPDRQARIFLIEEVNGDTQGVLVVDLGGMQSHFHLAGPKIGEYFDVCKRFYEECHLLKWQELESIHNLVDK